jgi:alpha-galactosidase
VSEANKVVGLYPNMPIRLPMITIHLITALALLLTTAGIVGADTPAPLPTEQVANVPASARLQPVILPPDPKPAIHGPQIIGASPSHPFLFRIPATGTEPLTYGCADLPPGLTLDAKTGLASGAVTKAGRYILHLTAANTLAQAARTLTVVCGDHPLALTPPMGWDAVNLYANTIDDAKTRAAADGLITSGLAAHGWAYIHVNDTWQGIRDKKTGDILPNRRRFPDMKALADYVHGNGLKFGLTSAATEHTCAGYPGSLGFAAHDAATYASWGVDYLEYDWCPVATLDESPPPTDQPGAFKLMHEALNKTDRDIVFGVDTFGRDNVWDWAVDNGANSWVTSRQMIDDWKILSRDLFQSPWTEGGALPSHWSSPGLLMLGRFGTGDIRPTHLTPCEQMTQLSQYALLSAPLWLSCDLALLDPNKLHPSTTAMLTNDEVLAVNQDPAGHAAVQVSDRSIAHIWSKPLADGTIAVGLFNTGDTDQRLRVTLSDLGLTGPQPVRDLWLHQDLGDFTTTFATDIPAHGVALVKIGKASGVKAL